MSIYYIVTVCRSYTHKYCEHKGQRSIPELCVIAQTFKRSVVFAGAVQIWTVPVRLRPLASGMGTVTQHLFGDVPTPPFVGWLQGAQNSGIHQGATVFYQVVSF